MEKQKIYKYLWEEVDGYNLLWEKNCEKLAEKLLKEGWHRDIVGKWEICKISDGGTTRTCSNCYITQTVNVYNGKVMFRYCPYCGAKMR